MARRIALVSSSYHPYPGGVEEHVSNLARHLSLAGHEVVVWTVDRGEHLGVRDVDGVQVRYLLTPLPARDAGALARFTTQAPQAWRAWTRAHHDFRPDLLHVHCFGPNGLYALGLHRRFRTPLIVTSHGETFADDHGAFEQSALLRAALRSALRASDATTACSRLVATDLRSRFGAVTCDVVPNAMDPDEPGSDGGELPERWPREGTVVFALGRVVPVKGFDLLVRAFAAAAQPGEHLVIAGDGTERPTLERLAADLGVSHRVHFPGRLERPAVVAAMAAADLVVVPSRVEAFGIVALEAWRAGTPLVMTSLGGAADFVVDGDNGLLVDPEDEAALGSAIRSVLDDPAFSQRLAAAGSKSVRAFTWDQVTGDYLDLYDRVLDRGGTSER